MLVDIEDTVRAYEDEVEAITFNRSVHDAMKKFARNIVLRQVKVRVKIQAKTVQGIPCQRQGLMNGGSGYAYSIVATKDSEF